MKIEFEFTCDQTFDDENYCRHCDTHVIDLAKLTKKEIETLFAQDVDHCIQATFRGDKLVTRPAPLSVWSRTAAGVSLFTLLGCETPKAEPVALSTRVEIPVELSEQESATLKTLERDYHITIEADDSCEPLLDSTGEVVSLGTALTQLEKMQRARNKRDGNVERREALSPITDEDAIAVWKERTTDERTLVETLQGLERVVTHGRRRRHPGKKGPTKSEIIITKGSD